MLVDSHAHLNFPQFQDDWEDVIQKARAAGVMQIVNVGTNLAVSQQAIALADVSEGIYATAGFHPHDVEGADGAGLRALPELLLQPKVVAVGETGLDFFRNYAPHDLQEQVFRHHIGLARDMALPLIVHSRGAEDRVLDLLQTGKADEVGGVLHCFGGHARQARRAVDLGFYLGFGGTVTFRNSTSLDVALGIPPNRLLLETDCPYLAPVPRRGRRNEPAYVRHVAEFLAEVKGVLFEQLCEQTTQNARRLFDLADPCVS